MQILLCFEDVNVAQIVFYDGCTQKKLYILYKLGTTLQSIQQVAIIF